MINLILKYWKDIAISIGIIFIIMYFFSPKTEIVEVPVEIKVEVPKIVKEFDTIYEPKPIYIKGDTVKQIDSTFYKKYISIKNDSIKLDSLFKSAISINNYKERIEDDSVKIDLSMKVRGELLNYQLGYEVKPRTITVNKTIEVPIPTKAKLFGGGGVRLSLDRYDPLINKPVPFAGVYLKTKKDKLISLEFDTNKTLSVGFAWKF